jgi:hypothetical protein
VLVELDVSAPKALPSRSSSPQDADKEILEKVQSRFEVDIPELPDEIDMSSLHDNLEFISVVIVTGTNPTI